MKDLFCTLFYCDFIRGTRCCYCCRRRETCRSKCKNHPQKCGLAREKVPNPYHTKTMKFKTEE